MQAREQKPGEFRLDDIDLTTPEMVGGRRTYLARCSIPFIFSAGATDLAVRSTAAPSETGAAVDRAASGSEPVPGALTDMARKPKGPVIEGRASSTGVDSYGTEMSADCLMGMAEQFRAGVSYLPRHPNLWTGERMEWDDEIGRTFDARVDRAQVDNPADAAEAAYILTVQAELYARKDKTQELLQRLEDEVPLGQSIGGWFRRIRLIYADGMDPMDPEMDEDEYCYPERVVVEEVQLDHLAATRSPSNGDSWVTGFKRSVSDAISRSRGMVRPTGGPTNTPSLAVDTPVARSIDSGPMTESSGSGIDTTEPTRNTRSDVAPVPDHPTPEDSMTPEQLRALLAEALSPIATRLDALEARAAAPAPAVVAAAVPAPVATPPERSAPAATSEIERLTARLTMLESRGAPATVTDPNSPEGMKAKILALEARVQALAAEPVRTVRSLNGMDVTGMGGDSVYDFAVRAAEETGNAVAMVSVTKNAQFRSRVLESDGAAKVSRSDIEGCLLALCRAAEADTVIGAPTGW